MERINSVAEYIEVNQRCKSALTLLREVILQAPVKECVKWNAPAYTFNGENIIGLAAFNEYVGLWFHQGAFLKDTAQVLFNANEGKTRGLRQWRFTKVEDIESNVQVIEAYVLEAIDNQKAGKKIKFIRGKELILPSELEEALKANAEFELAYKALSKSKQIEYADHISEAKQEKTKISRLQKIIPMIIRGEGLNDKYRSTSK